MCLGLSHRPALCPVPLFLTIVGSGHLSSSSLFLTSAEEGRAMGRILVLLFHVVELYVEAVCMFDKHFRQRTDTVLSWWRAERVDTTALALLPTELVFFSN